MYGDFTDAYAGTLSSDYKFGGEKIQFEFTFGKSIDNAFPDENFRSVGVCALIAQHMPKQKCKCESSQFSDKRSLIIFP